MWGIILLIEPDTTFDLKDFNFFIIYLFLKQRYLFFLDLPNIFFESKVGFEPTNTCFADKPLKPLGYLDILVTQVGLEPTTALRSLRIKSAKLYQLSYCVILSSRMDLNHRLSSYQDDTLIQLSYETNCRVDRTWTCNNVLVPNKATYQLVYYSIYFLLREVESNHAQLNGLLFSKQSGTPFPSFTLNLSRPSSGTHIGCL